MGQRTHALAAKKSVLLRSALALVGLAAACAAVGGVAFATTGSSGPTTLFTPVAAMQILDTTNGVGHAAAAAPAKSFFHVPVTGPDAVPDYATAVSLSVTVSGSTRAGSLSVYGYGDAAASPSVKWGAGQKISSTVTAAIGTGGAVVFHNSQAVQVQAAVVGYFSPRTGLDVVYKAQSDDTTLTYSSGAPQTLTTLDLPAGKYLITARGDTVNGASLEFSGPTPTTVTCEIGLLDPPYGALDSLQQSLAVYDPDNLVGNTARFNLSADVTLTDPNTVSLRCGTFSDDNIGAGNGLITAIPANSFTP